MYIVLLCMEKGISLPCQSCMQFALSYDPLSSSSATALSFPLSTCGFGYFLPAPLPDLGYIFFFFLPSWMFHLGNFFLLFQFLHLPVCYFSSLSASESRLPHTLYSFLQTVPDHLWRYEWNQNKQWNNSRLPATPLLRLSLVGTYKRAWPAVSLHALSRPYLCPLEFVLPL